MKQSEWISKASKLHKACVIEQDIGNGSKRLTTSQATSLNVLQHAINSHHGRSKVTYNEARASLDEMFTLVKGGLKTPPLQAG